MYALKQKQETRRKYTEIFMATISNFAFHLYSLGFYFISLFRGIIFKTSGPLPNYEMERKKGDDQEQEGRGDRVKLKVDRSTGRSKGQLHVSTITSEWREALARSGHA